MTSDNYIVGTCETMCPVSEVNLRKKNNLVHYFERIEFVKEFSRSAADKRQSKASDLRTFGALKKTLEYLFSRILHETDKPFNFRYDFIFNRCRAVRQEIVIQNMSCEKTVKLLEPIALFLSFSLYRLTGSPISAFDSSICGQHLKECLLKCLTCYEEMDEMDQDYNQDNRIIIEGIYLMLNINDPNSLHRLIQLNSTFKSSPIIKLCIIIALNFHQRNYYKIIRDIQRLPHIICAVATLILPQLRRNLLYNFSIAYSSNTSTVPLDFLQRLLIYDNTEILVRDLIELDIQSKAEEKLTAVKFNRKTFDKNKTISHTLHQFVEVKFRDLNLTDLILLK
ncbi:CLUMA_CG019518, isoform A [Clunio marinus]|uniref:CLUMA_CG019518, isoform A n=1 Tax=Clunio marinus TaxID=568069 RepID=A0A1J1J3B1_9DIPT|nr:CLUMA_CG019518, isoform A [Clunio marinus]